MPMGRLELVARGRQSAGRGRGRGRSTTRRNRYANRRRNQITFVRQPFPKRMLRKLVYETSINLNAGIGTIANHAFNMISVYDPDLTGIGHQPYGWDQLIPNYDHAVVISTKAICTAVPSTDTNNGSICVWGICLRDTSGTLGTNPDTILEAPYCRYSVIGFSNGYYQRKLSIAQSTKKFMGVKDVLDNSQLQNTSSSGPSDGYVLEVFQFGANSTVDPDEITVRVRLEFNVMFIEPKPLLGS